MSRPIGLSKPLAPSRVQHQMAVDTSMSASQSQESTQQPSIEIKPAAPSTRFKIPLSVVPEVEVEAEVEFDAINRDNAQGRSNGDISASVAGTPSEMEESTESASLWTQTQLHLNGHPEDNRAEVEIVPGSSATDQRSSPEKSPQNPINTADRPYWIAAPSPPSRPSTSRSEQDELDESLPRDGQVDLDAEADDIPDPEPEPTEVDTEPPEVPTPENSQPPPAISTAKSPAAITTRSAPVLQLNSNPNGSSTTHMSPISRFTPSRGARLNIMGGGKRRAVSPLNSPLLSGSTSGRSRLRKRSKRSETPDSDDSSFGKDPAPSKDSRPPVAKFTEFMKRSSEIALATLKGAKGEDGDVDGEEVNPLENLVKDTEEAEEGRLESFKTLFKRQVTTTKEAGADSEEEEDDLNWDRSIGRSGDHTGQTNGGEPASPTPARHPNGSLRTRFSPPTSTVLPPAHADDDPQTTHQQTMLTSSTPDRRTSRRFNKYASSGASSPGMKHGPSQLFSTQGQDDIAPTNSSPSQSHFLQATQMAPRSSPPPLSSQGATAALGGFIAGLEPTQPDNDEEIARPTVDSEHDAATTKEVAPVLTVRTALAPTVSSASTTTSSKVEIPAHRQLQRRSRTEDNSPMVSPRTHLRNMPLLPLPTVIEPPSSNRLQATRSVPSLPKDTTSSPQPSPPVHRHSSVPLDDAEQTQIQETYVHPTQPLSSSPPIRAPALALVSQDEEEMVAPLSKRKKTRIIMSQASSPPVEPITSSPPPNELSSHPQQTIDVDMDPAPLEPTFTEQDHHQDPPTLPTPPIIKPTTPKRYKGPASRRRAAIAAVSPDPLRLSPRARKTYTPESSESGSTPVDHQDHSYRPAKPISKKGKEVAQPLADAAQAGPSAKPPIAKKKGKEVVHQARAGPSNFKRKRSQSSPLTPPAESDDGESSSAPEDPEDNTYQPTLMPAQDAERKGKAKASDAGSHTSSRAPKTKKRKLVVDVSESREASSSTNAGDSSRVFAQFNRAFYSGTVMAQTANGYRIKFDDGDDRKDIPEDKIRRMVLKKGEPLMAAVKIPDLPLRFDVQQDWSEQDKDGVYCNHKGKSIGKVPVGCISISLKVVQERFEDRLFDPTTVNVPVEEPKIRPQPRASSVRPVVRSPVKANGGSTRNASPAVRPPSSSSTTSIFESMAFLLTAGTPENNLAAPDPPTVTAMIQNNGGTILYDWETMFDLSTVGVGSAAGRSTCTFKNIGPAARGTPFLIPLGAKVMLTPKFMVALAKGIPCLSLQFVLDSLDQGKVVDWRSYLVSSGLSAHTGQEMSQTVDMDWGESDWDVSKASHLRQPLKGKKAIFIQPKGTKWAFAKTLAPVCLSAMGIEDLTIISYIITPATEKELQDDKWDYIVVEDRSSSGVPKVVEDDPRVCNMTWLKQCLIMGAALPASLHID